MSFLITAMGRSGTKFLASVMNRSEVFAVEHEPRGSKDLVPSDIDYEEVFTGNYGEVNSMMRSKLTDITGVDKGIILRNPYEIMLSALNRQKKRSRCDEICEDIVDSFLKFDTYLDDLDIHYINFHLMTADVDYLRGVLKKFNITDVELDDGIISKKINENRVVEFTEVPDKYKEKLSRLDFFIEKWELHNWSTIYG